MKKLPLVGRGRILMQAVPTRPHQDGGLPRPASWCAVINRMPACPHARVGDSRRIVRGITSFGFGLAFHTLFETIRLAKEFKDGAAMAPKRATLGESI